IDQDRLNHPCVIKLFMLSPAQDQKATDLFNQEAVRLYELGKHDQIPELFAHFEQNDRLYLVQEFIDGQSLIDELEQLTDQGNKFYQENNIRATLADLLPVLKFIHDKDVIHRDIKPANIIRRQSDGKLVLIDFGVAKQATAAVLAKRGTMIGTLGYAPAEQIQFGEAYCASDLYALGATCIHLLTGKHPFNLYNSLEGCWIWQQRLPEGTMISSQLTAIIDKLLKVLVKDRYQTVDEVLKDLIQPERSLTTTAQSENLAPIDHSIEITEMPLKQISLASEKEVDYRKLRDLLSAGKWQEADQETRLKMLEVMGQQERGYLDGEDIEKFPCQDFETINQLWLFYSENRFGFSVQKRIWLEEGGKTGIYDERVYEKFGDRVGWRQDGNWRLYSDLTFSSNEVSGHLPLGLSIGWGAGAINFVGVQGAVEVDCLFSLVDNCDL
ncbi:MAG: serine/threonine-protein kinase, partial [Coleofasciculaceae cyanobacterium]